MSEYDVNGRVRFPRSSRTGDMPTTLKEGSFAINWPDKKIYVGTGGDVPVRFTQWLEDWANQKAYKQGDFVIYQEDLWRALEDIDDGAPWDPTRWLRLTATTALANSEPLSSDIFAGGAVTIETVSSVRVAAGNGIVVDNTTPTAAVITEVSWAEFVLPVTYDGEALTVLAINSSGTPQLVLGSVWNEGLRRDNIALAVIAWTSAGEVVAVLDASIRAGGTAETVIDQYTVNGGAYRAEGGRPAPVAATLNLAVAASTVFSMGSRWRTDPKRPNIIENDAINPLTFDRIDRGLVQAADVQDVDPNNWDNAGVLSPVTAGKWTIQYLYGLPDYSGFFLQYGQTQYDTVQDAVNNLPLDWDAYTPFGIVGFASIVFGAVIVEQGSANLDAARVVNALRGLDPFEGLAQETNTDQFYLLDGTRSLTGDMDADGNAILNAVLDGGVYA